MINDNLQDILAEATIIRDKHGSVPPDMLMKIIQNLSPQMQEAFALALGITAGLAVMMPDQQFFLYNTAADQYLCIKVQDKPPLDDGVLVNFDNEEDGYVQDGVRVDRDGVAPGKACPICGGSACEDANDCAERRRMLNGIRSMGRATPVEGLPDVDAKEDEDVEL